MENKLNEEFTSAETIYCISGLHKISDLMTSSLYLPLFFHVLQLIKSSVVEK